MKIIRNLNSICRIRPNVVCLVPPETEQAILEALRFFALIQSGRKGEMPVRNPYTLYGAIGQQCLSMIYSNDIWYTRIADLCTAFAHPSYLDRPTVERILAELARNEFIQPHGFQNRYGPAEKLNKLVDYRMIYGNFGASSQQVEVRHGEKVLGSIPATNLLRVIAGNHVRFAGQCWRIRAASPDGIAVEPIPASTRAIDFTYDGSGVRPDAFVLDRIWNVLYDDTAPLEILDMTLRARIEELRKNLRLACGANQIPFSRSTKGFHYITCAGYLVNKAIALVTNQRDYLAEDISLIVEHPVSWSTIPTDPETYERGFPMLFEPTDQSLYQTLLPVDLQRQEFMQGWLKDASIRQVLFRLAHAEGVEMRLPVGLS
jgi:ATP-dependent helicase Lhr and Lhr-like helicase